MDFDRVKDKDDDDKDLNFGLRTDIYGDKKGVKVSTVRRNIGSLSRKCGICDWLCLKHRST